MPLSAQVNSHLDKLSAADNAHLYLVDDWIIAENVTHGQHHAALNANLHDRCAVFCSCLKSRGHIKRIKLCCSLV